MLKRTYGQVKAELARVAGQTGLPATDVRVRESVSIAQERLCVMGEWPFNYARLKFRVYGGLLALPAEYSAIVHLALDREPAAVMPSWFEFLDFGPGPTDRDSWKSTVVDYGEAPVFRQPGAEGATVRVVSTSGSDTGNVIVTGHDMNGVRIVETFALPDATSSTKWSKITGATKPTTAGEVVLSLTDAFGEKFNVATWRPQDQSPSLRIYRVPVAESGDALVHCIARRKVYPVTGDADDLIVTNLAALRLGVKAVALEDSGKDAEPVWASAATILAAEARLYKPNKDAPPVRVSRVGAFSDSDEIY
jgi:hypothetical protein